MFVYKTMPSPVGVLRLTASDAGLVSLSWQRSGSQLVLQARRDAGHPVLLETERQLREYFAGARRTFDLKLELIGSDFQQKVWRAIAEIPYAETRSYGEVAAIVGHPGAARAIGTANASTKISIVTPCHRVIGSSGKVCGPQADANMRTMLLEFERRVAARRGPRRSSKTAVS